MNAPTKKELRALAARALGEGAVVVVEQLQTDKPRWYAEAGYPSAGPFEGVNIWAHSKPRAARALAAALRALAGEVLP